MKLTKAAFAVAAILGSVAVSAQTANVTLYGFINTSIESNRGSTATTSSSVTRMTASSSQWGMRGSESLGGGLSAIFNLQSGFGSDDGTLNGGAIFNREAWVGLQGGFGQLRVGYGLTAYDDVLGLSHQNIGSTGLQNRNAGLSSGPGFAGNQLFTNYGRGGTAGCATDSNFDARAANSLSYQTPDFAGFRVRTTYALIDEVPGGCKLWDTGAVYSNGPITAGLAYSMHSKFRGLAGANVGAGSLANTAGTHDQNTIRGYGRYNFGVARIDAAYEVMSFKVASGTLKAKYWEVGTQVPVGAANFGLQYSQRDNGTAWAYVPPTGYAIPATTATLSQIANIRNKWTVGGGKHLAFVADYSFSKRSQAYAYFSNLKNETNGKQNTLAIGLIHRF